MIYPLWSGVGRHMKQENFIVLNNAESLLVAEPNVIRMARDYLSYKVEGSEFANNPYWDGRVKLMIKVGSFPTGLIRRLVKWFKVKGLPYKVEDRRIKPSRRSKLALKLPKGWTPRDYQIECADLARKKQRGVFNVATGGGKSLIAAMIIEAKDVDTLIVTPGNSLREQLADDLIKWFGDAHVSTKLDSGKQIIISNIQHLAKQPKELLGRFRALLIDEFHHSGASSYKEVSKSCVNAFYRYGLTGTFFRTDGTDMEMHGVLSEVIYRKTASDLIKAGWLAKPYISIHTIDLPPYIKNSSYRDAYNAVIEYGPLNEKIVDIAETAIQNKKRTLILVRRKAHGELLKDLIQDSAYICGDDCIEERESLKAHFERGSIRCLIATSVFGEGVDIPAIDVLINARYQKTEIETVQGIGRALRIYPGKTKAEVHDFLLKGQRNLNEHSRHRINGYKKEPEFEIEILA